MYPLNDKDLDRLSRDAAEHYDVESSASGWERLEMKLDKELPVKGKDRRRFLLWLFFIALLSGGALVYMLSGSPINSNLASHSPEIGKESKTSAATVREADGNTATVTENTEKAKETSPAAESNAVQPNNSTTAGAQKTTSSSSVPSSELVTLSPKNKTTHQNIPSPSGNKVTADRKNLSANKPVRNNRSREVNNQPRTNNNLAGVKSNSTKGKINNGVTANDAQADKAVAQKEQQRIETVVPVTGDPQTDIAVAETKAEAKEEKKNEAAEKPEAAKTEQAAAKKPDAKKNKPSKWEFGLLTGPDFTNVEFQGRSKMGFNIGAIVGYRLSNRWLINTGLIYTTKYYQADGEYFNPPAHSWISYQDVEQVTGSCSMIEIPLNVRYDFSYNNKGRFFASTGVSSYIMDKQDYECTYYNNAGELRKYPWKTDSNYNYFLSNVNLSLGYERAIGRNFSVQAEPYLKLPLQGLGYGSMKMSSYGVYVTFKYKPGARIK